MSSLISVSVSRSISGNSSLIVMIAWALLCAMILPLAPHGLMYSQQVYLIWNTLVSGSNNQDVLPESFDE